MAVHLLDINLLVALAWPNHAHHEKAHGWFSANADHGWATSPMTQCGFVRISANQKIVGETIAIAQAVDALRKMIAHPKHVFWHDDFAFLEGGYVPYDRLIGYRQVTDAYLVGLARRNGGRLATLDAGTLALVASGEPGDTPIILL